MFWRRRIEHPRKATVGTESSLEELLVEGFFHFDVGGRRRAKGVGDARDVIEVAGNERRTTGS